MTGNREPELNALTVKWQGSYYYCQTCSAQYVTSAGGADR